MKHSPSYLYASEEQGGTHHRRRRRHRRGNGPAVRARGRRVVIADVDDRGGKRLAGRINRGGGEAVYCRADVSRDGDCAGMVEAAEAAFGALHILFNNAGIMLAMTAMRWRPRKKSGTPRWR